LDLGPAQRGARFTPVGGMRAIYLAADPETAIAEVNQVYAKLRRQDPPVMAVIPACMIYSAHAVLDTILDVSDPDIQAAMETSEAELCDPTWRAFQSQGGIPLTQQFGQAVFDYGSIQAIRYSSALMPGHQCYVVFTERLTSTSFVEIDDPDGYLQGRLP
jgi:RES domain-containing protein